MSTPDRARCAATVRAAAHDVGDGLRPRLFYGWAVVAAAFTVTLIGFGSAYTFSVFAPSLQRVFAASRGSVSLVFSLAGFLYFGLGVVSGPLAERFGARPLAVFGMVSVGLGLMGAGLAQSLAEVYVAYGLGMGVGVGCAYVPALAAVQRWFVRRRAFASGIAVSGAAVGTLVMPPLSAVLIAALGWRATYLTLGGLAVIVGAGMALFIADDPRNRGCAPDGAPLEAGVVHASASGMGIRSAVRSARFVRLYAICFLAALGLFVPFAELVPYALEAGLARSQAAQLLAIIGVGSLVGRFTLGGLADRLERRLSLAAMVLGMALAFIVWLLSTSFPGLALFALLYGMFYGGFVAILPAFVMDVFGGRHISALIGILYTAVALGTLIGPSAAGFAFDFMHSYTWPLVGYACADLLSALVLLTFPMAAVSLSAVEGPL